MQRLVILFALGSFLLLGGSVIAEPQPSFVVIVHVENPTEELSVSEVSKLFLKKVKQWKSFHEVVCPVDLVADSPVRQDFSRLIHGRKISSIKAYWQKQIFSGRGVPPEEKKSDREVIQYVAENVGAIGYVSSTAQLRDDEVKVVTIIDMPGR